MTAPLGSGIDYYVATGCWVCVWQVVLRTGEGPRAISTAYRINFLHGVISTIVATLCLTGYLSETIAVPCSLGYFVTDIVNMLLNDFFYRVASYQGPQARKAEYFHHLLCIVVCLASQVYYADTCHMTSDPVVRIMLAEVSTPFLILFRQTKSRIYGLLFVISFLACRTVYQCFFLMPEIYQACPTSIGLGLVVPYVLLQAYFTIEVVSRAVKPSPAKKKE